MANYSTLKYKGIGDAGFAKTTDVTASIDTKVAASKRDIIGQLDRQLIGGSSSTDRFLDKFVGGAASTTSFEAEYDGGSANG